MRSSLILIANFQTNGPRRNKIAAAVRNSAIQFEGIVKRVITESVPAGRTYRRGAIVRPLTRRNSTLKLEPRGKGVVVGFNFHRASAKGQPPARDTGRLINSIRAIPTSELRSQTIVGVAYAAPLDNPAGLNRPFFFSQAELFRPVFVENIRKAAFEVD